MNLKFMERSLSEKHKENGLYIDETPKGLELRVRFNPYQSMLVKEFDSRCPCQSVVDAADQYLGELTAGINFEEGVEGK